MGVRPDQAWPWGTLWGLVFHIERRGSWGSPGRGVAWSDLGFKIWVLVGNRLCRGRGMEGTAQKLIGLSEASQVGCRQGGEKWSIQGPLAYVLPSSEMGKTAGAAALWGRWAVCLDLELPPDTGLLLMSQRGCASQGFLQHLGERDFHVSTHPHPLGAPPDRKPGLLPYPASSYSSSSSRPDVASPMKPPASLLVLLEQPAHLTT